MANEVYQLVVRKGPRPGQVFLLELDVLTIGRDPISDIIIEDPEISRHHAKLTRTPEGYELQDMGSTNGSFVDGQRLSGAPVLLKPGQVIMLGSNVTLVYNAAPASDPLATVVAPAAEPPPSKPAPEPEEEPAGEPAEEPGEEPPAEPPGLEPAEEEPLLAKPVTTEPLEPLEEPQPEEEEDDAIKTMLEQPEPEEPEPLPTFDEPEPEPEPPADEIVPKPEPGQLPDYEAPIPLPSSEEPEPEPPPAVPEEPPVVEEPFDQTVIDSGQPLPDFDVQRAGEPPPIEPVGVAEGQKGNDRNRNILIAVVVVLLLCCCCLIILAILFQATDGFQNLFALNSSDPLIDSVFKDLVGV